MGDISRPREGAKKAAEGAAQKFSMGVTLPTVPARLVKRILSGEFVDMGELYQDALRAEFRRSSEGDEQKASKPRTFRSVADRDVWVASFAQYAGVICRTHPEKAVALWVYRAVMMSCQNRTMSGWWKGYDVSLRHSYSSMDEANFLLNQCLFMQTMVENSEPLQCAAPPGPMPVAPQRPRRKRVQAFFAWNNGRPCTSMPCPFSHTCVRCGG